MSKLKLFCADCCIRVTALLEYLDLESWGCSGTASPPSTEVGMTRTYANENEE